MQDLGLINQPTTSPSEQLPHKGLRSRDFTCIIAHLGLFRLLLKVLQLGLSLAAFVVQAGLENDTLSWGQIFFACVCCFGFLLCFLVLVVYCTSLCENITKYRLVFLDLWIAAVVGMLFPLASSVLARGYEGTSEKTGAVALGFAAGLAFFTDALMVDCDSCSAERERPEENAKRPLNLAENQPLRYEPL